MMMCRMQNGVCGSKKQVPSGTRKRQSREDQKAKFKSKEKKTIKEKSKLIVEKPLLSLDWWRLGEDPILVP